MKTSVVSVGYHFAGNRTMPLSSSMAAAEQRIHRYYPRGKVPAHALIAGPHAPYLPYWLPPIRRLFAASICFGDFETRFSLVFRLDGETPPNRPVRMSSDTYGSCVVDEKKAQGTKVILTGGYTVVAQKCA